MAKTRKSLCQGKSTRNPNRCRKVRGCKIASGPKRTFCRKKHNRTRRKTGAAAKKRKERERRAFIARSPRWSGFTARQVRELKKLVQ